MLFSDFMILWPVRRSDAEPTEMLEDAVADIVDRQTVCVDVDAGMLAR